MLGRWDERLIDQASDVPSIIFSTAKIHSIYCLVFYNFTKIKIEF